MSDKDIWSEHNAEAALLFLRDTDKKWATLKAEVNGLEKNEKPLLAGEYLDTEGTVDERKSQSLVSIAYREWLSLHKETVLDYSILTAERNTKMAFLECWRSVYSARKRGNV